MDIKIDSSKLVALRKKMAWSQQHLADVSNLNVKTIQRLEKNGVGSYESIKSIAAAFNISPDKLQSEKLHHPALDDKTQKVKSPKILTNALRFQTYLPSWKSLALGIILGVALTQIWQQVTDLEIVKKLDRVVDYPPSTDKDFVINADEMTRLEDKLMKFTGNVAIKVKHSEVLTITSDEFITGATNDTLLGNVSIELSNLRLTAERIDFDTDGEYIVLRANSLFTQHL